MKKRLIQRYLRDECTGPEREEALRLLATPEGEALLREVIAEESWEFAEDKDDKEEAYQRIWSRLRSGMPRRLTTWYRYGAVASLLLLVGAGAYWFTRSVPQVAEIPVYAEYSVPTGKTARLTLPDGSRVWLNAHSRLKYPKSFRDRNVELEGEAYFEVHRDPAHPFVIRSGSVQTKVLGTSFNVRAYADEPEVEVAVLTGKVNVSHDEKTAVNLTPKQRAVFDKSSQKLMSEVVPDVSIYRSWTEDNLVLNNASLAEIGRMLHRRFGIDLTFSNEKLKNCRLTTRFDHPRLEKVLAVVSAYVGARYRQDGNSVTLTGKGCN
ncbi:FecR family protein [Siphonobacter aquaeclarae]|uniref:FecR family protein n=1 Tax=Siphonobacter aquaeclarae TaxID=563176 RepID=UPI000B84C99E|nr:FecR domain-containing protein [Siphonobacter aquaeclarae]